MALYIVQHGLSLSAKKAGSELLPAVLKHMLDFFKHYG